MIYVHFYVKQIQCFFLSLNQYSIHLESIYPFDYLVGIRDQ